MDVCTLKFIAAVATTCIPQSSCHDLPDGMHRLCGPSLQAFNACPTKKVATYDCLKRTGIRYEWTEDVQEER